jgi:DNA-binding NtrC family response regulator
MKDFHVLIVEDDTQLQEIYEQSLIPLQVKTFLASDGKEALERCSSQPMDLILTDLSLPLMDGLEFVEQLRHHGQETPVIVLSGYGTEDNLLRALRLGVMDFISKPVSIDLLESTVSRFREVVERRRKVVELELRCFKDPSDAESRKLLERENRMIRLLLLDHHRKRSAS